MASDQTAVAPVISVFIFKPGLGPPVARGVLIQGQGVYSGLFSPWPESLAGKEFGIFVPGHENEKAQWLVPNEVCILEGDEGGGTFGVVSFTSDPARKGGEASQEKFNMARQQHPNASRLDAVKASLANELETLATPDGSLQGWQRTPETAAKPEFFTVNVAGITPADFICRHLLHWD
jgi:hypothetical protein